jgi:glyoxylase-like metal-dependent hydrolase (beta-lactamase superfamily II)
MLDTTLKGVHPSAGEPLSFAPSTVVRAFTLDRPAGDLVVYAAPGLTDRGGITAHYLNHWHETTIGSDYVDAPRLIHEADAAMAEVPIARTFTGRQTVGGDFELIPIPGHTPGSTAFLWNRILFTGDQVYLHGDEWVAAVLANSDRAAYIESLELLKTVEFDVLVPWAASVDGPWYSAADDRVARLDAIIERLRRGADR